MKYYWKDNFRKHFVAFEKSDILPATYFVLLWSRSAMWSVVTNTMGRA